MRFRNIALMFLMLALAMPAMAQEQRASIEGVVKDATGAVMPGVTVEARNEAVGVVVTAVTDANGVYRFPALSSGIWDLTATLSGFNTASQPDVPLTLGQIKKVDMTLSVAGVAESVQVTAESPLVDVKQSARSTSIRNEQIDLLPKGRDFTSLVTQAPGANNEGKLGGLSIDGASAGENRYIIDGIETTDLNTGTQGAGLIVDFVEEVQVKSSGYTAEYGGATGGVINAVTKSGSNSFRGNALFNWQGDNLESGYRPILRRDVLDNSKPQYWTYPEDEYTRMEPGFSVGGPLMRDKMWFFGAYQPALTTTTRSVDKTTSGNANSSIWSGVEQKVQRHYISANSTAQIGNSIRTRVSYNNNYQKTEGRLPNQDGTTAQAALLNIDTAFPNWSLSANLDWVATPNFYLGFRGGYYLQDVTDEGVPDTIRYLYSRGNVGQAGVPASFQAASGYSNVFTNNARTYDKQTRSFFQSDATYYLNAAGQHTFKGGVQFDRVGNDVLTGEQKNLVRLQWNSSLSGQRGEYGYYQVRSNGSKPEQGFVTEGNVSTNNIGLFIQDAWTVNNRLTINAGLRTEQEKVPTYVTGDPNIPEFGIEWGFGKKLAPRLGFAYDIKGDGRWKAYGSWGIFYDIFKLQLPRGSWGGDKWLEYYYTLDTYDYNTLMTKCPNGPTPSTPCAGTLIRGPIDFRHVSLEGYIEPDLEPMKSQELSFGFDHQLNATMAIGVRWVHKQLDYGIEDVGQLDADQNEIYLIANPGFGIASTVYDVNGNTYTTPEYPKAVRDYDSVEFVYNKLFANNWSLRTSYMWSRLYGNYSGLSQSDENGRTSPNVGRAFDYPLMMFNQDGEAEYGLLATDRPHQFKAQGMYLFKFGTSVGANFYASSGIPVTREISVIPPNNFPMQYEGRVSDGRMPTFSQTDIFVQHEFRMGGAKRLQISLNVINLFDQKTATNRFTTYNDANGVNFDEQSFYANGVNINQLITQQGIVQHPLFLKDNGYQGQRVARFGVKFIF
jgi:hypothetical protein